jgi:hypothetical protein
MQAMRARTTITNKEMQKILSIFKSISTDPKVIFGLILAVVVYFTGQSGLHLSASFTDMLTITFAGYAAWHAKGAHILATATDPVDPALNIENVITTVFQRLLGNGQFVLAAAPATIVPVPTPNLIGVTA